MSHFAVAVISKSKNKEEIEEILKPYWEELDVEPYIVKTKKEIIEEARKWKKIIESGKETYFPEKLKKKYLDTETDEELYELEKDDYEQFDENGNQLSTYNPNSRWDWFEIGGRFRNLLLTKKQNENVTVVEYPFRNYDVKRAPVGFKYVNSAKIKDVDFKKMEEVIGYAFCTWALVDENDWYEKGKMGFWCMSNATKETEQSFVEKFQEYMNSLENQDKYITIVDCHI